MRSALATVACPGCGQSLPSGTPTCQFCGAAYPTGPMARGGGPAIVRTYGENPSWVEGAYKGVCLYFLLSALIHIGLTLASPSHGMDGVLVFLGPLLYIVLGIGLLVKSEFFRMVSPYVQGVNILFAAFGIMIGGLRVAVQGPWAYAIMVVCLLDIAANAWMYKLLWQTE